MGKVQVASEPSDASTVKPSSRRKDSLFGGGDRVVSGSVASLPVRGITQSMVDGGAGRRSVVSHAV